MRMRPAPSERSSGAGHPLRTDPRDRHILFRRQPAYRARAPHFAISPHGHASAPPHELRVAEVGNVEPLFGMPRLFADLVRGLALARRGPGLIDGDLDGGDGSAVA